ncbi:MAG: CPBP family intramembrane glutamic endopeptidase [Terracidiphilus sp.]
MSDPALDLAAPSAAAAPQADLRRIPHLGHALLLGALFLVGLFTSVILILVALHYKWFGVARVQDAMLSLPYALGTMVVLYVAAFVPGAAVFPPLWRRPLLAGLEWNASTLRRHWWKFLGLGVGCFLVALAFRKLLHFPAKTLMGDLLTTPAAIWTMFAFAITLAPLCEEIVFRGFLLPAFATACDWTAEKLTHRPPPPLLAGGHPRWSLPAMTIAAIPTSLLFAALHSSQNAYAWGPFALLFSVSLILCAVRLASRSVAASTLTHATYNCTLFVVMFFQTQGFHHLHP